MKYYNLFILTKREKEKEELIRDEVGIENAEVRVHNKVRESLKW